eukprot:13698961-Heterocapsa_arctica.AAC.1
MAGSHATPSGILITAAAPCLGSPAIEHSNVVALGKVDVSHPDAALCPALPLLCWRVCKMLMHRTNGRCLTMSLVQAWNTFARNMPYGESAEMPASTAALAMT